MPPWRYVRNQREMVARFVDGPLAGTERTVHTGPDANPPPLLTIAALPDAADGGSEASVYELVSWGDRDTRYRVRT